MNGKEINTMEVTKAMQVCAEMVQETPCWRCEYRERCSSGVPCSRLGRYLAFVKCAVLPPLQAEVRARFSEKATLTLDLPRVGEEDRVYAAISCHVYGKKRAIFRLPLQGTETGNEIYEKAIRACLMNKGKF